MNTTGGVVGPAGQLEDPSIDTSRRAPGTAGGGISADVHKEAVVDPRASRRGDPKDLLAGSETVATRASRTSRRRDGTASPRRSRRDCEELFGEERVAAGPLQRAIDEIRIRSRPSSTVRSSPGRRDPAARSIRSTARHARARRGRPRTHATDRARRCGWSRRPGRARRAGSGRGTARRSRVEGSAHWRSSMMSRPARRASRWTTPSTSSKRRTCVNRSSVAGDAGSSSTVSHRAVGSRPDLRHQPCELGTARPSNAGEPRDRRPGGGPGMPRRTVRTAGRPTERQAAPPDGRPAARPRRTRHESGLADPRLARDDDRPRSPPQPARRRGRAAPAGRTDHQSRGHEHRPRRRDDRRAGRAASRAAVDEFEPQGHAVGRRAPIVRGPVRARHRRVRVAAPEHPISPAISPGGTPGGQDDHLAIPAASEARPLASPSSRSRSTASSSGEAATPRSSSPGIARVATAGAARG